jgi:hypothetical protein
MPGIAISYRREDTGWITGRIFDRLKAHYQNPVSDGRREAPEPMIFMDYDSTPVGLDFRDYIRGVLDRCDIVLAIIGPRWIGDDGTGRPRLQQESDWVRIEIETALKKNIPVVPVLIDRTPMPSGETLPGGMRDLIYRQAAIVDTQIDFNSHVERLIREIDRLLEYKPIRVSDPSGEGSQVRSSTIGPGTPATSVAFEAIRKPKSSIWEQIARRDAAFRIGLLSCFAIAVALTGYFFTSRSTPIEPTYTIYSSAELGLTIAYPHNFLSLDTTERRQRRLSLKNGEGQTLVTILRAEIPAHRDPKIGRDKEVDELKRMGYTLTYIAPEREQNWKDWYVISGLKHGTEFYFRRWYCDDSVVSIEFIYPKEMATLFDKLIPTMSRELAFSKVTPKLE